MKCKETIEAQMNTEITVSKNATGFVVLAARDRDDDESVYCWLKPEQAERLISALKRAAMPSVLSVLAAIIMMPVALASPQVPPIILSIAPPIEEKQPVPAEKTQEAAPQDQSVSAPAKPLPMVPGAQIAEKPKRCWNPNCGRHHPKMHHAIRKVRRICIRTQPIIETGGSLAQMAIMIYQFCSGGTF
mgnify:CR=1 FL=1